MADRERVDEQLAAPRAQPDDGAGEGSQASTLAAGEADAEEVHTTLADLGVLDHGRRYPPGPILGAGGMGTVELRRDEKIGRRVAYKTLHPELDTHDLRRRFLREALAQAQLEHPAIVPVYDIAEDDEGLFFTMKRVRGQTLARVIHALGENDPEYVARFTPRRLLAAFLQVCQAVHHAHLRGVLHRDLKPSNVMLGELGEVYVLDWGVARIVDEDPLAPSPERAAAGPLRPPALSASELAPVTSTDVVLGTLGYMPPEQLAGVDVDRRADVYALGVVLYEILTLRSFRSAPTYVNVLAEIADGRIARPSDVCPDVDPELDAICARATAIAHFDRYESAKELAEAIERVLDGARDAEARAVAAGRHLERARALLSESAGSRDGARVDAMHELLRAVTLDAEAVEARRLLVDLVSRDDAVPEGAKADLEHARVAQRLGGLEGTMMGLLSWLLPVPIVLAFLEVRSWTYFWLCAGPTLFAIAFAGIARARRDVSSGAAIALASLLGAILVGSSFILGPFAIVPTMAATCSMFFAMHVTPGERTLVTAILALAALVPFALDASGLVPPGFAAEGERIVLFPRMLELPAGATTAALAWVSGSFTVFSAIITGRLRDRLERAEHRNLVSAWHLRQLFAVRRP